MPENTPQTTMGATIEVYLTFRKKISLDTFGQLAKHYDLATLLYKFNFYIIKSTFAMINGFFS